MDYRRHILVLEPGQLEAFCRDWVERRPYHSCRRFSGGGDMGRDVVGFASARKHDGAWDNYQCKQYSKSLSVDHGVLEVAKILYYALDGNFGVPAHYYFVAPKGVSRSLENLITHPSEFKQETIETWDARCRRHIRLGVDTPLTEELKAFIESYDFATIDVLDVDDLLDDESITPVLVKWFGADPGPPPHGQVPGDVRDVELSYVEQLVHAYSERDSASYAGHDEIADHEVFGPHLARQRERFYDADAFKRFYRDNTDPDSVDEVEREVYHGVADLSEEQYPDNLARVNAVLKQAANLHISGVLGRHARVQVKQGLCHHLVNACRLWWYR